MAVVNLKKMGLGPTARGEISVWEEPLPDTEYIIGADVAQGATFGTAKQSADLSTFCVLKRDGMALVQVAEADYRCENYQFGQIISALGSWYNHAWVNVERNLAHGVIAGLKASGYPQERWYIPPLAANVLETSSSNYFFHKNVATQKVLLDTVLAYMDPQAPRLAIRSKLTLAELASLQMDAQGRVNTNGKDRTIALAMAVIVDATTETTTIMPKSPIQKHDRPPHGVDPELWLALHGITKRKPQETDEAPDWDGSDLDGVADWSLLQ